MSSPDFITICRERGFFHQCTDEESLRDLVKTQSGVPAYIGFDCTAPSLHVGSLLQIMLLRWWQKCGHKPIVLMGGGTTKIGDPSGKDEARKMLTDDDIAANMDGIKQVFAKFLTFENSPTQPSPASRGGLETSPRLRGEDGGGNNSLAVMVNNDDWLKGINYIDFLRDYGRHFSVNRMMSMDSVKLRLERESHLSFLEFNYMILQAYDFVELNKLYACRLQMGGSDQWGNIVGGVELHRKANGIDERKTGLSNNIIELRESGQIPQYKDVREKFEAIKSGNDPVDIISQEIMRELGQYQNQNVFGLTSPLITTSSGAKMGKTAQGAVWLNYDESNPDYSRSPYDYWQFWRNTEDDDVERFLKLFTDLELPEIADVMKGNINDAKKRLATEATTLLHGANAAQEAAQTAHRIFVEGGVGGAMPEFTIERSALEAGIPAFKLLHMAGLAESGGEARRLIKGNGAKINDAPFTAEDQAVTLADLTADGFIKLSKGKKQHIKVLAA